MVALMEIAQWLGKLGLPQYARSFAENDIDFAILSTLSNDDLKELGIHSVGHRKLILSAIINIAPPAGTQVSEPPPFAQPPAMPSGERRPVAVLFADLCGYTALSRQLDPEDLHALLQRFFAVADRAVVENGGHVDKHIGDSVMGVFGAPVSRGDDALRASKAAMAILAAMPDLSRQAEMPVEAHLGLAFGEVVASGTGSAQHTAYTVTGDTVNLAARLTSLAGPGCAYVSDDLARQFAGDVDVEDAGVHGVKGVGASVQVWRLVAVRPHRLRAVSVFVGRKPELAQIQAALETCLAERLPTHIHVRGDPGVGKSRFVEQLAAAAVKRSFEAHSAAFFDFGQEQRQSALMAMAASLFPVLGGGVLDLSSERDPVREIVLRDFAGAPLTEAERARLAALSREAMTEARASALAAAIAARADSSPQLLMFEDIHWADRTQFDTLVRAFARLPACPVAMVTTSRFGGDPLAGQILPSDIGSRIILELGPLRNDEARLLASALIAGEPSRVLELVKRSGGNPLFLEHLTRHTAASAGLPETIQSVVLAEADRLSPEHKNLLQCASVLGQRFSHECLRFLTGESAPDLQPLAMKRLLGESGGDLCFAHALIRDAVYGSLLAATRSRLHLRAAEFFASRDDALHAQHLALANDNRAGDALVAAAGNALARNDPERALSLSVTARGKRCTADQRFELASLEAKALLALGRTGESVAAYEAVLAEATAPLVRARIALGLAGALRIAENLDRAFVLLQDAQPAFEESSDWQALSALWHLRGNLHFPKGQLEQCQSAHERALEMAALAGSVEHRARALGGLGDAAYVQGRLVTARQRFKECADLARSAQHPAIEAANANMAAMCQCFVGPLDGVLSEAWAAVDAARSLHLGRAEIIARHAVICALLWSDAAKEVQAVFDRCQDLSIKIGARRFVAENLAFLAEAERMLGRPDNALRLLHEALPICRETGMSFIGPIVLGFMGICTVDAPSERLAALAEGDALLAKGGIAHNCLFFGASALESCLLAQDWDRAEHYAGFLERTLSSELLPFPSYLAARGRALARWGRGPPSARDHSELTGLATEGRRLGYLTTVKALDAAIADFRA